MKEEHIFPSHLYHPTRLKIGLELMQKELGKLLPSIDQNSINSDVQKWLTNPEQVKMAPIVDFWDAVDAVMGGIKLKSVCQMITAENYTWKEETVNVKDIILLANLDYINEIPGIGNDRSLGSIGILLDKDPAAKERYVQIAESRSKNPSQDSYRIIVERNPIGELRVHDGNRRAALALLRGQEKIKAWVFNKSGEEPRNYWVSVQILLALCKIYRHNKDNSELANSVKQILRHGFESSDAAKVAFRERVLGAGVRGADELAQELL